MDLDGGGGTRPVVIASPEAKARARRISERALSHYGRGEIELAARLWLAARDEDPSNTRVQRYIEHVRDFDGVSLDVLAPAGPELTERLTEPIGPPRSVREPEYIENPPVTKMDAWAPAAWVTQAEDAAAASAAMAASSARNSVLAVEPTTEGDEAPPPPPRRVEASYRPRGTAPLGTGDSPQVAALLQEVRTRVGADDFSGALELAERILTISRDHPEALAARAHAATNLERHLESKIGDLRATAVLRIPADEVIWLNLNHREGFLLSQIDGSLSFEDILDVCGMPRLDALRVLANLVSDKVIAATPAPVPAHAPSAPPSTEDRELHRKS